jgi:anthranilate synthase component 2
MTITRPQIRPLAKLRATYALLPACRASTLSLRAGYLLPVSLDAHGPSCTCIALSLPGFTPQWQRPAQMLLLIDNYDSFTYNLVHYLGELGADVKVVRNDALDVQAAMALKPEAIVLSPGPCDPDQAGICLPLTLAAAETGTPLLGVCLGHQTIGQAFGGKVVRCHEIVHGKMGRILHEGQGMFAGLPSPFLATRYHSLIVERASLPDCLEVTAWLEDGTIMGLRHREKPIEGVQFHPESIASEHGHQLLKTFLDAAKVKVTA